jgi:hypothetical protein
MKTLHYVLSVLEVPIYLKILHYRIIHMILNANHVLLRLYHVQRIKFNCLKDIGKAEFIKTQFFIVLIVLKIVMRNRMKIYRNQHKMGVYMVMMGLYVSHVITKVIYGVKNLYK